MIFLIICSSFLVTSTCSSIGKRDHNNNNQLHVYEIHPGNVTGSRRSLNLAKVANLLQSMKRSYEVNEPLVESASNSIFGYYNRNMPSIPDIQKIVAQIEYKETHKKDRPYQILSIARIPTAYQMHTKAENEAENAVNSMLPWKLNIMAKQKQSNNNLAHSQVLKQYFPRKVLRNLQQSDKLENTFQQQIRTLNHPLTYRDTSVEKNNIHFAENSKKLKKFVGYEQVRRPGRPNPRYSRYRNPVRNQNALHSEIPDAKKMVLYHYLKHHHLAPIQGKDIRNTHPEGFRTPQKVSGGYQFRESTPGKTLNQGRIQQLSNHHVDPEPIPFQHNSHPVSPADYNQLSQYQGHHIYNGYTVPSIDHSKPFQDNGGYTINPYSVLSEDYDKNAQDNVHYDHNQYAVPLADHSKTFQDNEGVTGNPFTFSSADYNTNSQDNDNYKHNSYEVPLADYSNLLNNGDYQHHSADYNKHFQGNGYGEKPQALHEIAAPNLANNDFEASQTKSINTFYQQPLQSENLNSNQPQNYDSQLKNHYVLNLPQSANDDTGSLQSNSARNTAYETTPHYQNTAQYYNQNVPDVADLLLEGKLNPLHPYFIYEDHAKLTQNSIPSQELILVGDADQSSQATRYPFRNKLTNVPLQRYKKPQRYSVNKSYHVNENQESIDLGIHHGKTGRQSYHNHQIPKTSHEPMADPYFITAEQNADEYINFESMKLEPVNTSNINRAKYNRDIVYSRPSPISRSSAYGPDNIQRNLRHSPAFRNNDRRSEKIKHIFIINEILQN